MRQFDKIKAFDELLIIFNRISSKSTFLEQMQVMEEAKLFLETIYKDGFEAGVKSKVNTLKKLN